MIGREKTKILLVDDIPVNLIAMEKMICTLDIDIYKAKSGEEAIDLCEHNDFALILLDVHMPTMDGYQTATRIRQNEKHQFIPIIFITALSRGNEEAYLFKGYEAGAVDFLFKPIKPEIFRTKVRVFLELYQQKKSLNLVADLGHEIDERKRAEEERQHLIRRLEEKNDELSQIIYFTSHDLRSPLLNIQGFGSELAESCESITSILKSGKDLNTIRSETNELLKQDIPEMLQFILSSTTKMEQLLSGLLRLSRLGRSSLNISKIEMKPLISTILKTMEYQIKAAGVKFTVSENIPSCFGDQTQVDQVVSNLIDNAIKYLDPEKAPEINISGEKKGDICHYCVEDNGIGIRDDSQKKVFEIFERAYTGSVKGEGLGLAIVRRVLERHHGEIWIESEEGVGSKFFFSLPAKQFTQGLV